MEEAEKEDMSKLLSALLEGLPLPENQLNINLYMENNDVQKKKKKKKKGENKIQ